VLCAASGGRGYHRRWPTQGNSTCTCGRRIPMGVLHRMGRHNQVGLSRHMRSPCPDVICQMSASGDRGRCRALAAVGLWLLTICKCRLVSAILGQMMASCFASLSGIPSAASGRCPWTGGQHSWHSCDRGSAKTATIGRGHRQLSRRPQRLTVVVCRYHCFLHIDPKQKHQITPT
jgi:hypothetical protein